jgi:hypothetical protein
MIGFFCFYFWHMWQWLGVVNASTHNRRVVGINQRLQMRWLFEGEDQRIEGRGCAAQQVRHCFPAPARGAGRACSKLNQ